MPARRRLATAAPRPRSDRDGSKTEKNSNAKGSGFIACVGAARPCASVALEPEDVDAAVAAGLGRPFELPVVRNLIFDRVFLLLVAAQLLGGGDIHVVADVFAGGDLARRARRRDLDIESIDAEFARDGLAQPAAEEAGGRLDRLGLQGGLLVLGQRAGGFAED